MSGLAQQLVNEGEGPSSATVYYVNGYAHIGRGVCVDKHVPGAGLPDPIRAQLDFEELKKATALAENLPGYQRCNDVQQAVLVSMCYQLGSLWNWPRFKAALAAGDHIAASNEMLDSLWARETPKRANREAKMMKTGEWSPLEAQPK